MTRLKVCGLSRREDIEMANFFKLDYVGFVFAKSKRQIGLKQARELKGLLNPSIQAAGVFVNEPLERLRRYTDEGVIDLIQLHGDETADYIEELRRFTTLPVIKAVRMDTAKRAGENLKSYSKWIDCQQVDYLLLDTCHEKSYGGSGRQFDWSLLKEIQRPYFLAGGIGIENIEEALSYKPYAIDVSSKMETDGVKDKNKVKVLVNKIRGGINESKR